MPGNLEVYEYAGAYGFKPGQAQAFARIRMLELEAAATSENGLWTIKDGKVEFHSHQLPPEISVCCGNLYVADVVMLMAGLGGA